MTIAFLAAPNSKRVVLHEELLACLLRDYRTAKVEAYEWGSTFHTKSLFLSCPKADPKPVAYLRAWPLSIAAFYSRADLESKTLFNTVWKVVLYWSSFFLDRLKVEWASVLTAPAGLGTVDESGLAPVAEPEEAFFYSLTSLVTFLVLFQSPTRKKFYLSDGGM